jgi:hypothetical protein
MKVWVGSVVKGTPQDELIATFLGAGYSGAVGAHVRNELERPYAFVEFRSAEEALAASEARGLTCRGSMLIVRSAGRKKTSPHAWQPPLPTSAPSRYPWQSPSPTSLPSGVAVANLRLIYCLHCFYCFHCNIMIDPSIVNCVGSIDVY